MNPVKRTRDYKNRLSGIVTFAMLDSVFAIIFALGLYGKFAANGNAFHPFLNDSSYVTIMIAVGAIGMIFCAFKIIRLVIEYGKTKRSL